MHLYTMLLSVTFLCFFVIVCGTLEYQLSYVYTQGVSNRFIYLFIYFSGSYSKKRTTHPVMEINILTIKTIVSENCV